MCKIYGYARISTAKQNIERQIRNITTEYPTAAIFQEVYTGTKFQSRKELQKLLGKIQSGDTIVFDSVSRMSRNAEGGIELYFELYEKGVNLIFLKEHHIDTDAYKSALASCGIEFATNTDTAENTLVSDIMAAVNKFMRVKASDDIIKAFEQAQKEVDDLRERTKEGIETAKRNGKLIGGAANAGKSRHIKKAVASKEIIRKHSKSFGGNLDNKELMKLAGISEPTLLKYKQEIRLEMSDDGKILDN